MLPVFYPEVPVNSVNFASGCIFKKLTLLNFKNYQDLSLEFNAAVNCFTGMNGSGKTNLLDAIHYLSMTKSYFTSSDSLNIRHGEHLLMVQGEFDMDGIRESVNCGIRQGQKKQFKRNQKEYERLSDHIGVFPVVMIAPTDQELITEGSEIRRKFLDSIISQYDHNYLEDLIRYNQILSQRNAILKQSATRGIIDWQSLSVWDDQLVNYGIKNFYQKGRIHKRNLNRYFANSSIIFQEQLRMPEYNMNRS